MKPVVSNIERFRRVAIVGAGLLGGSFGLAIREAMHMREGVAPSSLDVIGVSRSEASRDAALRCGAVTSATACIEEACEGADLVVIAVPVDAIASMVVRASELCRDDALIIDLGSTKSKIVRSVDEHPRAQSIFVGTHPIAGSEKTGAEFAKADLFSGKTVIVTPGAATPGTLVERAESLWRAFGSHVVRMSPEEHDVAMASVSHVPHLVASMLAGLLAGPQADTASQAEKGPLGVVAASGLVGSGWLDTTRVASGDADLWTAICRENGPAIVAELARAAGWLEQFSAKVQAGDFNAVRAMLAEAKRVRDDILASKNGVIREKH